jgi:hypothetical protein
MSGLIRLCLHQVTDTKMIRRYKRIEAGALEDGVGTRNLIQLGFAIASCA